MFHRFLKHRTNIFICVFSFILGCTLSLVFLNLDACPENLKRTLELNQIENNKNSGGHVHFLVVLVVSSPANFKRRHTLRETWLKTCADINVKYYFVIGSKSLPSDISSKIESEQNIYSDILILEDILDTYSFLTRKVLSAFVWIEKNKKFQYILKCDDDSFVHVKELVRKLKTIDNEGSGKNLYWGFFNGRAAVKKSGKWKENGWILCDYYLPYALGGGYVLSHRLVSYITRNADDLALFSSEDVSVGVWLANKADVNRLHDPRFDTEYRSRGCSNSYLVTHKQSETEQSMLYENLQTDGKLCEVEFKARMSYIYNWNVPPSQCCVRSDEKIP
ncbi:beta-1,3-galactosyltransferase 6 [Anabrus simplex]|uniref:beta-1,3-galactosyltransferase 6 n=1 Tax=Anabrus simplex TaxID=316456 RepID=UPI0035A37144